MVHLVADHDACAAVLHEEAVVRGLEQGVGRDRDRAHAHSGEEAVGKDGVSLSINSTLSS